VIPNVVKEKSWDLEGEVKREETIDEFNMNFPGTVQLAHAIWFSIVHLFACIFSQLFWCCLVFVNVIERQHIHCIKWLVVAMNFILNLMSCMFTCSHPWLLLIYVHYLGWIKCRWHIPSMGFLTLPLLYFALTLNISLWKLHLSFL